MMQHARNGDETTPSNTKGGKWGKRSRTHGKWGTVNV